MLEVPWKLSFMQFVPGCLVRNMVQEKRVSGASWTQTGMGVMVIPSGSLNLPSTLHLLSSKGLFTGYAGGQCWKIQRACYVTSITRYWGLDTWHQLHCKKSKCAAAWKHKKCLKHPMPSLTMNLEDPLAQASFLKSSHFVPLTLFMVRIFQHCPSWL